jgi:uncharacterized phiE125 gp8 family phage protein
MSLRLYTAPVLQPLTLTELKAQLRLDTSDEDTYLTSLLVAATVFCEDFQNRSYLTQTWDLGYDAFPSFFRIPRAPLQSISSITYVDPDGTTQTLASTQYRVDTLSEPGRVFPAYTVNWPEVRIVSNSVLVRFVSGWTSAALVPSPIKQAIALLVAHWFEHREPALTNAPTELPFAVDALLWQRRILEAV